MKNKRKRIGLFGLGCVGAGLYEVLTRCPDFPADIVRICVKDQNKLRQVPSHLITYDKEDILLDPSIDLVVELINDSEEAYSIIQDSLQAGKAVVSANKKAIAEHLPELLQSQEQYGVPLLYEAAVGGAIPVIRTLEEYYDNDTLFSIEGILNGTTNYVLSQTNQTGKSFSEVLCQAQALGFAETDPTMDIDAFDPAYKLCILITHAFGTYIPPEQLVRLGIRSLSPRDVQFARNHGYVFRLVAKAYQAEHGISAYVIPQLISQSDPLYHIQNENNAIKIAAQFSDEQWMSGKGAGSHTTASAVLSDISALTYNYRYGYKKRKSNKQSKPFHTTTLRAYIRYEDETVLQSLGLQTIWERFEKKSYRYVIADIPLSTLIKAQSNTQSELFIAELALGQAS